MLHSFLLSAQFACPAQEAKVAQKGLYVRSDSLRVVPHPQRISHLFGKHSLKSIGASCSMYDFPERDRDCPHPTPASHFALIK